MEVIEMVLIRPGGGIIEIRGGFGGVYFTRDKSGLHQSAMPRRVRQQTTAQRAQRKAFEKARAYSKDERSVSYNIYRTLNGLPCADPPADYAIPRLQAPPE